MSTRQHLRRRRVVAASILLAASGSALSSSERIERFDILRNGSQVGWHEIRHRQDGDEREMRAISEIEIGFLGITLYTFRYEATERWDDAGLVSLRASVNDDGEKRTVEGQREGSRFLWTVNGEQRQAAMPVFPTNHWNADVLAQQRVLNTLTGRMNDVAIRPVTDVEGADEPSASLPEGNRYRYSGDLQLDSWYDSAGQWRGMRFAGDDGSTIVYRCISCSEDRFAIR